MGRDIIQPLGKVVPPANDLALANYHRADRDFVFGQRLFGFPERLVHKKIIGRYGLFFVECIVTHQISLLPFGTFCSTEVKTISPFSSAKPVTRNSDIKVAICFLGKLITPTTWRPTNCSLV